MDLFFRWIILITFACSTIALFYQPSEHTTGIVFLKRDKTYVVQDYWKIVLFYDLNEYAKEYEKLVNYTKEVERLCDSLKEKKLCYELLLKVKEHLKVIEMRKQTWQKPIRRTRSLLRPIGSLYNLLFGLLDGDDKERYDAIIDNLTENQKKFYTLAQDQTTIIKTAIEINEMAFNEFKNRIDVIYEDIRYVSNNAHDEWLRDFFESHIQLVC